MSARTGRRHLKNAIAQPFRKTKCFPSNGTGHQDIVQIALPPDKASETTKSIIEHRRQKIEDALTKWNPKPINEVQAPNTDVLQVVFVVHGIRDYGRWSAPFRKALEGVPNTVVISPRYGYFGMGPFLFGSEREKFVKWFMDEVTEAKALYPKATRFDFVGHSNGTYLLARALQQYESLELSTVVFAGSVVNRGYEWNVYKEQGRVKNILNIKGDRDWVVALFPELFEFIRLLPRRLSGMWGPASWSSTTSGLSTAMAGLSNKLDWYLTESNQTSQFELPIGSGGFCGFEQVSDDNELKIKGAHSAFTKIIPQISDYVKDPNMAKNASSIVTTHKTEGLIWSKMNYLSIFVFILLAIVVVLLGFWVVSPARQYSVQVGIVYVVLLLWFLQRL